ncbi:MAG TPA: FAD:protein FMN transferase [Candidatus Latescibacteria bacterium]|nr:FAD:protein FMN transferase [Candidatus Latescibacterota bacterium]
MRHNIKLRVLLLLGLVFIGSCASEKTLKFTEFHMGTFVEITIMYPDKKVGGELVQQAFNMVGRIDSLMNVYSEKSEVSILNRQGRINASRETAEVILRSIEFSRLSAGAFDVTIRPLANLWRMAKQNKKLPEKADLERARRLVNYHDIVINQAEISLKRKGMQVDLGGIAKGYAIDKAIDVLRKGGIKRALVNGGGDIYALGKGPRRGKWRIGIQHPRRDDSFLAILSLRDRAVATSGDYQRYFTLEGKRYSHIINPKTGRPVQDIPMSVTVIAPDCTTADALATAVFVLGPERGLKLIEDMQDVEGLVVSADGKAYVSSGMKDILVGEIHRDFRIVSR